MTVTRRLIYLASFVGLAVTAVLAVDRMGRPSIATTLAWVAVAGALAGAPGLVWRRAWPAALALLPLGALLVVRAQMPAPPEARGFGEQTSFYAEQLRSGAMSYATHSFPMDFATAGDLKLLLALVIYGVVGLAAFAALSLRRPVAGLALLLVPLGFGLTVDGEAKTLWLPIVFIFFAGCVLLTARALGRRHWGTGDTAIGLGGATLAVALAVWALGVTPLAAGEPWQDWRTWDVNVHGEARFGFDSMEGYAGLLDPENDEQVMSVSSPIASYWRANALEGFDGTGWFSAGSTNGRIEVEKQGGTYTYTVPSVDLVPPGTRVRQSFEIKAMQIDYFFTGGVPETLTLRREVPLRTSAGYALGVDRPLGPDLRYSITAAVPKLRPGQLVGRGRDYPEQIGRRASLPFPTPAASAATATEADWRAAMAERPEHGEWLGLYRLNQAIVGDATDPYEIALRIEQYLRFNYTYSLTAPSPREESPYADFLLNSRQGFCQHFAGAMAVLLRFNGVPARVAVGFTTGVQVDEDAFMVSSNDAHAWVEAYFPGVGWVQFEPTPGERVAGVGASSTSTDFWDPYEQRVDVDFDAVTRADDRALRGLQEDASTGVAEGVAAAPGAPSAARPWLVWAVVAGAALALVAWPLGRALLRRRALRRGDPERRLRALLALVYAELDDFGLEVPRAHTLDETAALLRERLGVDAGPLVGRLQAVFFGGRAATAADLAAVAALRRELRGALRTRYGRRRAALALYGLPAR